MIFAFEESSQEIRRNARSVGFDFDKWVERGLLRFETGRPSLYGLEMHLARMNRDLDRFKPQVVVIDPISAFRGPAEVVHATFLRMIDLLKSRDITAMFTSLHTEGGVADGADLGLSSLMDVWIKLTDIEADGERNRIVYLVKARGMSHSNQVREYQITDSGITLMEPYVGPEGVLTGTARLTQAARERAASIRRQNELAKRRRDMSRRRQTLERQISEQRAVLETEEVEMELLLVQDEEHELVLANDREAIALRRGAAE